MDILRAVPSCTVFLLVVAIAQGAPYSGSSPAPDQVTAPVVPASAALRDAVRRVWDASPEAQASRALVESARAKAEAAAQPIYNPALGFDAENADVDRRAARISLPLDLSGKRDARASQGAAELRASEARHALLRRDIAARWLTAWSTATLATRQVELGRQRVESMRRFDQLAAQRLAVGDISSPERDLAGLALGEAQIQQAALEGNEAAARAVLAGIGGAPADDGDWPSLPGTLPSEAAEITPRTLDDLPQIATGRAELAGADARVVVARRARIPDPELSLTGGQVRVGGVTDRVIGVGVSIPLPVFNDGRAEVMAARAKADAASASLQAQRQVAIASLHEAKARYGALHAAAVSFRGGRTAAFADRTALLEKLWRAGEIGTSDYLVQLKQSLDTALSGQELESRLWQAWFDYLAAAGRLADWIDGRDLETSR